MERPWCGAADEGDAALAAGEHEPAVRFSVFAWKIRESEVSITLQARLQLQQLLHDEGCSENTALLKLLLNEKLCHMQVTSFMSWYVFLWKMSVTILTAIAMTLWLYFVWENQ